MFRYSDIGHLVDMFASRINLSMFMLYDRTDVLQPPSRLTECILIIIFGSRNLGSILGKWPSWWTSHRTVGSKSLARSCFVTTYYLTHIAVVKMLSMPFAVLIVKLLCVYVTVLMMICPWKCGLLSLWKAICDKVALHQVIPNLVHAVCLCAHNTLSYDRCIWDH